MNIRLYLLFCKQDRTLIEIDNILIREPTCLEKRS